MGIQQSVLSAMSSVNSLLNTAAKIKKDKAESPQLPLAAGKTPQSVSPQSIAASTAKQSADNAIEAKKAQRRNFMDYLGKQSTSLGGTVSQLPPAMQKQIASQYTKSQRRTMMNRMDKEAQGGTN